MQVAALLLERAITKITDDDAGRLLDRRSK
jgi:hypothetical protein